MTDSPNSPKKGNSELSVAVYEAQTGQPWVHVTMGVHSAWVSLQLFVQSEKEALSQLADGGIYLIYANLKKFKTLIASASKIRPNVILATRPGWLPDMDGFVLATGEVVGRVSSEKVFVAFPHGGAPVRAGSLDGWRDEVVLPIVSQSLPTFAIMAALAAPLLALSDRETNFGFEVVGQPATGKSTVLHLAASVSGGASRNGRGKAWDTWDATTVGISEMMRRCADRLLILDEAAQFQPEKSDLQRGKAFCGVTFNLSAGHEKAKHGSDQPHCYRLIWLSSTNLASGELFSNHHAATALAARDRMIPLRIAENRPHGVFDSLPNGINNGDGFVSRIEAAMGKHHGHAYEAFVRHLTILSQNNSDGIRGVIRKCIRSFQRKIGVDLNDGSSARISEAFGLVCAAGKLARAAGILPRSNKYMTISIEVYHKFYADRDRIVTDPLIKLKSFFSSNKICDLTRLPDQLCGTKRYEKSLGFKRINRKGEIEYLARPSVFANYFTDHKNICRQMIARGLMCVDSGRDDCKRRIVREAKMKRVLCFTITSTDA